jgi:hypothetical protein
VELVRVSVNMVPRKCPRVADHMNPFRTDRRIGRVVSTIDAISMRHPILSDPKGQKERAKGKRTEIFPDLSALKSIGNAIGNALRSRAPQDDGDSSGGSDGNDNDDSDDRGSGNSANVLSQDSSGSTGPSSASLDSASGDLKSGGSGGGESGNNRGSKDNLGRLAKTLANAIPGGDDPLGRDERERGNSGGIGNGRSGNLPGGFNNGLRGAQAGAGN